MSDNPRAAFAAALVAFQADIPHVGKAQTAQVKSDKGNYSYGYADLTDITEAATPLLAKQGLAFNAYPTLTDAGFVLRYELLHESGYGEGGDFPLPDPSRSSPQQIGSWLTYSRRYCLCAVTGIAPGGDDDDGQKATDARASDIAVRDPGRSRGKTTRTQPDGPQDDEWTTSPAPDLAAVYRLAGEKGIRANDAFAQQFGGLHPKSATPEQVADFMAWLEQQEVAS